jgi:hypothetical protein
MTEWLTPLQHILHKQVCYFYFNTVNPFLPLIT